MKFSSSFKVGLLTLLALVLLIGVVFKVKGRTFSSADRIEIQFKDVNGMRPGAGVQMMGLRVGQVEEIKYRKHQYFLYNNQALLGNYF